MADESAQSVIERNIRRNLGTFTVPQYLDRADHLIAHRAMPARRDGLSSAQPSGWWRETIDQERKVWLRGGASDTPGAPAAPAAAVLPAASSAAAQPAAPIGQPAAAGYWSYYAAGVTPCGPGGGPAMVYAPCWMPLAA